MSSAGSPITYAAGSELVLKRYGADGLLDATLTLDVDYTLSAPSVATGAAAATFTLAMSQAVLATTERIVVERLTTLSSSFSLASTGGIFENALDKTTRIIQELNTAIGRRVEVDPLYTGSAQLPAPEAGAFLAWNSDGAALENMAGVTDVGVSVAMAPVVQALTLQLAAAAFSFANTARDTHAVTQSLPDWVDFDDTTGVLGSRSAFWFPVQFGLPGTGRIYRFNRVFVGAAALGSADAPPSVPSCIDAVHPFALQNSQFLSIASLGGLGVTGASRTSDAHTAFPANTVGSGGSQGVNGYGINDDTATTAPIAVGLYGVGTRFSGVGGVTMAQQLELWNAGSVVTITPNTVIGSGGQTFNQLLTAGKANYTSNVSAAQVVGDSGSAKFRKGRVFGKTALDATLGAGGTGVTDEFYIGHSQRWLDGSDVVKCETYGAADGFHATGIPRVVASSAVAVSHTGDTNETTLATIPLLANSMGPNGWVDIECTWSMTNSANGKTAKVFFNGTGGTAFLNTTALANSASARTATRIQNVNAANSQKGALSAANATGWGTAGAAPATAAIDTTANVDIVIRGAVANSGETITLERYTVTVFYGA